MNLDQDYLNALRELDAEFPGVPSIEGMWACRHNFVMELGCGGGGGSYSVLKIQEEPK